MTVIQTDHDHDNVSMTGVSRQLKEGDKLISTDHSHPGIDVSTLIPSGFDRSKKPLPTLSGDRGAAQIIEKYFPNVTSKVYVPMTKEYIRYNSKKVF